MDDESDTELLIATQASVQVTMALRRSLTIPHIAPKKGASLGARQLAQLPSFTTLAVATIAGLGEVVFAGRQQGAVVAWRTCNSKASTLLGDVLGAHKGAVTALVFYARRRLLVSGSADYNLKIFDATASDASKNRCIQTIPGHDATVTALAAHCDLIISGSADKTLKVWKFDEEREGLAFPWLVVKQVFIFDAWIYDIWASPTKDAESSSGEVFVADGGGGVTVLRSLTTHSENATEVVASGLELLRHASFFPHPASSSSAVVGGGGGGRSAALQNSRSRRFAESPKAIVKLLAIPGLNLLVSLSFEDRVRVADISGFHELLTVAHPDEAKRFVDAAWIAEHEELLLLDNDAVLWLWNTRSNSFTSSVPTGFNSTKIIGHYQPAEAVDAHPGGGGGGGGAQQQQRSVGGGSALEKGNGNASAAAAAVPSLRGSTSLWVANREAVHQVRIGRTSSFVKYQGHTDRILGIFLNPHSSANSATTATALAERNADVNDIDFHFLTASVDNTLCLWTQTMTLIKTLREKFSEISCFHAMPSNRWCITGHDNGSMKFWNVAKDRTFRFVAHDNTVSAVGEGWHRATRGRVEPWHHLFSISYDGCLALWEVPMEGSKAKCEARIRVSGSELVSAAYDGINYAYIVGDNGGNVTMWSVDELRPLRTLQQQQQHHQRPGPFVPVALGGRGGDRKGGGGGVGFVAKAHQEAVTGIVLDGNYVFTGSEDSAIYLWNGATGALAKELVHETADGLGEIECMVVLDELDGALLVSTRSGQLLLFSQETGRAFREHRIPDREITGLCWSAATDEIVAGLDDGTIIKVHLSVLSEIGTAGGGGGGGGGGGTATDESLLQSPLGRTSSPSPHASSAFVGEEGQDGAGAEEEAAGVGGTLEIPAAAELSMALHNHEIAEEILTE